MGEARARGYTRQKNGPFTSLNLNLSSRSAAFIAAVLAASPQHADAPHPRRRRARRGSRQLAGATRVRPLGMLIPLRGLLHLLVHHPHHLQVRARLHRRHAHRCPCRHLVRALLPVCCGSHALHSPIADVCARLSRALPLSCRSPRGGSKGRKSEVALKRSFTDAVVQRARAILARCACPCRESIFQGKSTSLSVGCRHHKPPLRGGGASGRRGQIAGSAAPDRAKKTQKNVNTISAAGRRKSAISRKPTEDKPVAFFR